MGDVIACDDLGYQERRKSTGTTRHTGIGKLIHREEKLEAGAVQQRRKENSGIAGLVALALLLLLLGVANGTDRCPCSAFLWRDERLCSFFLPRGGDLGLLHREGKKRGQNEGLPCERWCRTHLCDPLGFVSLLLLPRLEEVLSGLELQIDLLRRGRRI